MANYISVAEDFKLRFSVKQIQLMVRVGLVNIGINECLCRCLLLRAVERRLSPGSTATMYGFDQQINTVCFSPVGYGV